MSEVPLYGGGSQPQPNHSNRPLTTTPFEPKPSTLNPEPSTILPSPQIFHPELNGSGSQPARMDARSLKYLRAMWTLSALGAPLLRSATAFGPVRGLSVWTTKKIEQCRGREVSGRAPIAGVERV